MGLSPPLSQSLSLERIASFFVILSIDAPASMPKDINSNGR